MTTSATVNHCKVEISGHVGAVWFEKFEEGIQFFDPFYHSYWERTVDPTFYALHLTNLEPLDQLWKD